MLDENTALLWVMEHPEHQRVTALMVTENAFAVGDGWIGQLGKVTWRGHYIPAIPNWHEVVAKVTELREQDGYVMAVPPQEVRISISHHRDIRAARTQSTMSPALAFTVSRTLADARRPAA